MAVFEVVDFRAEGGRVHIAATVTGYPAWLVFAVVMPTPTGPAIAEMTIHPDEPAHRTVRHSALIERILSETAGEAVSDSRSWSGRPDAVPAGGIPTRLLRRINAGELLTLAQQYARRAAASAAVAQRAGLPVTHIEAAKLTSVARDHPHRPGRKGWGVGHYLDWAVRYAAKIEAGVSHPVAELAAEYGETPTFVRDTITDARRRYGLLTNPPGQGRPGGQLTQKALRLIAEREKGN